MSLAEAFAHSDEDDGLGAEGLRSLLLALPENQAIVTRCSFCPGFEHHGTLASGRKAFTRHAKGRRHMQRRRQR